MYRAQVWFATGNGWTSKSGFVSRVDALRIAREYMSDAKAVRIQSATGSFEELKMSPEIADAARR